MKDRTDSMNRGFPVGEGGEKGYSDAGMPQNSRERKNRQLKWANLDDNEALECFENTEYIDQDMEQGGFLPRNNYEDRN